jgi:hypothetical protein
MTGAAKQWTDEQFYHLLKDIFPTPQEQEKQDEPVTE